MLLGAFQVGGCTALMIKLMLMLMLMMMVMMMVMVIEAKGKEGAKAGMAINEKT